MNNLVLFIITILGNFLAFGLIALWYVVPRLRGVPRATALSALLFVNTFRTEGLTFIIPQVADSHLSKNFTIPAAAGDLLATVLAFLALLALRGNLRIAIPLVWLLNVEGIIDLFVANFQGWLYGFPYHQVGVTWFIPSTYVVLLIVNHLLIFWLLLRPSPEQPRRALNRSAS